MNILRCSHCGEFASRENSRIKSDPMTGSWRLCIKCFLKDVQQDLDLAATSTVYSSFLGEERINHLKNLMEG